MAIASFLVSFLIILVFVWLLERIAVATERIARALEAKNPK